MEEKKTDTIIENAHEVLIERMDIDRIFAFVEKSDYLLLFHIEQVQNEKKRVYVKDLSEKIHRSIPEISKMMAHLQDKGYINWKTDETKENTYVLLTGKAVDLMEKQKQNILECYQKVKTEISKEDLEITMKTMNKIREIILKV